MSYSETSAVSQGRFWPNLGQRLPLSKAYRLGLAVVSIVSAAVFLTWMLVAGPWQGGVDSVSTVETSRSAAASDGIAPPFGAPAPGGFSGGREFSVTVTNETVKGGPRLGRAEEQASLMVTDALGQRQIISQGSMSVEVPDVSFAAARVRAIAESVGGFVEQLSSNGVGEFRQSTLTVRVPQAEFFSVFEQIKALGEVQNENAGSNDVTEQFIDLEARLKSAQRKELSLLSLLDRADKISEILIIEQELSRVRSELERLQGQLNLLERRVDLATISVFLTTPPKDSGQAPSGSLTIESSDVGGSANTIKAVVNQVGGEIDQVFTSIQDGRQRVMMTVRVFAKDFDLLVAAVEDQGGLVSKEVREGKAGDSESDEPNARLDIAFQEKEASTLGRNLGIFAPLGSIGLIAVLGAMLYGAYRMGIRRGD